MFQQPLYKFLEVSQLTYYLLMSFKLFPQPFKSFETEFFISVLTVIIFSELIDENIWKI